MVDVQSRVGMAVNGLQHLLRDMVSLRGLRGSFGEVSRNIGHCVRVTAK